MKQFRFKHLLILILCVIYFENIKCQGTISNIIKARFLIVQNNSIKWNILMDSINKVNKNSSGGVTRAPIIINSEAHKNGYHEKIIGYNWLYQIECIDTILYNEKKIKIEEKYNSDFKNDSLSILDFDTINTFSFKITYLDSTKESSKKMFKSIFTEIANMFEYYLGKPQSGIGEYKINIEQSIDTKKYYFWNSKGHYPYISIKLIGYKNGTYFIAVDGFTEEN